MEVFSLAFSKEDLGYSKPVLSVSLLSNNELF